MWGDVSEQGLLANPLMCCSDAASSIGGQSRSRAELGSGVAPIRRRSRAADVALRRGLLLGRRFSTRVACGPSSDPTSLRLSGPASLSWRFCAAWMPLLRLGARVARGPCSDSASVRSGFAPTRRRSHTADVLLGLRFSDWGPESLAAQLRSGVAPARRRSDMATRNGQRDDDIAWFLENQRCVEALQLLACLHLSMGRREFQLSVREACR